MGLQQMDADGRIGGEPMEPQQAELSDDDLNSIIEQAMQQEQPMMANKGGVVGYKHGGYHPPDFLGMSVFGDKGDKEGTPYEFYDPDVGGYKPTAGDYGTTTPEAPTVTANVPDPVCPPGPNGERQRYDKSKGMCVPVSEGPTTEPEDPKPSVPFGSDFNDGQGVNWVDPADVLKFAKTFDTGMISKDVRTGAGLATAFIPGAAPIAALGALGGKIDATQDVAGLKASRIISAALGQTKNVKQIGGILEKYEKKFGDGFSGTFGIGTGFNYAASALGVERKDIKEFMEVYDDDDKSAEEKLKAQKTLEGLITNSKIIEENRRKKAEAELARLAAQRSAAQVAQQQAAARRNPNVIPGSGGGEGPDLLPSQVKSGYVSGNVRGLSNPQRAEIDRSSSKIDKQDADSFEDLNTGGLVQKRKKKK
jgi:DNA-binding transcriptional MerR regulator